MWKGKKVSVVMPAYNEEEAIKKVIDGIKANVPVDEIVVADNNSKDRTAEEAVKAGATVVVEKRQGFGYACKAALQAATGDYVILFDSGGDFPAKDMNKLLEYADDFEYVKGTRARKELCEEGIYSPVVMRLNIWANICVSKLQQLLFSGPALTDAGCTLRLIRKPALEKIFPYLTVGGWIFLVDMMNVAMIAKLTTVEVPVRFVKRAGGKSKAGAFWGLSKIALQMISHTVKQRILAWGGHYDLFGVTSSSVTIVADAKIK